MKKKLNKKKIIYFIVMIFFSITFIFSGYKIVKYIIDTKKTNDDITNLQEIASPTEVEDTEETVVVEEEIIDGVESPYTSYTKMNLLDVNFDELKSINSDVVGWIEVKGTSVNYPFVQADNNEFYLDHSFNKSYNGGGWVFLDYRNSRDLMDKNNILYAHSMINNTMFGTLRNTLTDAWLNNTDNHIIRISTESVNSMWQVFSVYHIPTTSDYMQTYFSSDENFLNFANMLKNRSIHDFGVNLNADDKIITLSTCYQTDQRKLVHAKLIKMEKK